MIIRQKLKVIIFVSVILLIVPFVNGQRDVSESIATPYIGAQYGANLPLGELGERYGFANSIGIYAGYKTKRNWIYGVDGNFYFGNKIKIDGFFQNLVDKHGLLIGTNGLPAEVGLYFRGFNVNGSIGKIFPVWGPNPNSGIMIQLGAGYLWHKVLIDSKDEAVPQVSNDYAKGYDRLTIGANTSQFIGYNYMANRGILNFYAGFYFLQGFTKNQRNISWDFPDELVSKKIRFEHIIGVRVGWLIPIYKRQAKDFYYN